MWFGIYVICGVVVAEDVVKSVGRVFDVLELFSSSRKPLSATQVERRLNYPQSSTIALLKSLVALGYLSFDRIARSYFPTMRVAYLGQWLETALYREGHLSALMTEIRDATGESVVLSCQNDLTMQFLNILQGSRPLTINIQPGQSAPLFTSTIGLTALSTRSDEDIAKLAQRFNRRARGDDRIDLAKTLDAVREIRGRGHGYSVQTYVHGLGVLAWALPGDPALRPAILSVAGPADSIMAEADDIVREVRSALGAHPQ